MTYELSSRVPSHDIVEANDMMSSLSGTIPTCDRHIKHVIYVERHGVAVIDISSILNLGMIC
jgi:hypothetical protein